MSADAAARPSPCSAPSLVALLACVPLVAERLSSRRSASACCSFTVLATAWALFSGPTRYVSLATVAFFGIGAYTVAVLGEIAALAGWCC